MSIRKKAIKVPPEEEYLIKKIFLAYRIPLDQYLRRPNELAQLMAECNAVTGRHDTADDLLHWMYCRRKAGKWVTFNGTHRPLESLSNDVLTGDEWAALAEIYRAMNIGSDNFVFDRDLMTELAKRFSVAVGRVIGGRFLAAAIMDKRKRGEWMKLVDRPDDTGFTDINEVA